MVERGCQSETSVNLNGQHGYSASDVQDLVGVAALTFHDLHVNDIARRVIDRLGYVMPLHESETANAARITAKILAARERHAARLNSEIPSVARAQAEASKANA